VLREALLDLARLLVGVNVKRQPFLDGVPADPLEPLGGAGTDGVGGEADSDAARAELVDLVEVCLRRLLAEAVEAAARVGGEKEWNSPTAV
jgi:hypothetical protein